MRILTRFEAPDRPQLGIGLSRPGLEPKGADDSRRFCKAVANVSVEFSPYLFEEPALTYVQNSFLLMQSRCACSDVRFLRRQFKRCPQRTDRRDAVRRWARNQHRRCYGSHVRALSRSNHRRHVARPLPSLQFGLHRTIEAAFWPARIRAPTICRKLPKSCRGDFPLPRFLSLMQAWVYGLPTQPTGQRRESLFLPLRQSVRAPGVSLRV